MSPPRLTLDARSAAAQAGKRDVSHIRGPVRASGALRIVAARLHARTKRPELSAQCDVLQLRQYNGFATFSYIRSQRRRTTDFVNDPTAARHAATPTRRKLGMATMNSDAQKLHAGGRRAGIARAGALALALAAFACGQQSAYAGSREQAKRIHDRIVGTPPTEAKLTAMAASITAGDALAAAESAMTGSEAAA